MALFSIHLKSNNDTSSVHYIFESTSAGVRYQDGQGEPGHEDFETAPAPGFFRCLLLNFVTCYRTSGADDEQRRRGEELHTSCGQRQGPDHVHHHRSQTGEDLPAGAQDHRDHHHDHLFRCT